MIIEKTARETLTAVEMDHGDELHFRLSTGEVRKIVVTGSNAWVTETTVDEPMVEKPGAVTNYQFVGSLEIDGHPAMLAREVATRASFYEPAELLGVRIWLDAVDCCFDTFLAEKHGACRPRKAVRLAVQEIPRRICPVLLHPWCPLPDGGLDVRDCYCGEDVWMGAYFGASAHGGLDINHPAGTPIWTPIPIDDHGLFDRVGQGANNNRWRGRHTWPDGSTWILQVHHIFRLLVPENQPLPAGTRLAEGAGVLSGCHNHSHFVFKVVEPGAPDDDAILLDPWILFWQTYRDRQQTTARG